jgi:hypothetical protein
MEKLLFLVGPNQTGWHLKKWLQNVEKVGWVRQGAKGRQKAESTFTELR